VPTVALPPASPSTDHVTAVFVAFATDAVNCWVWPVVTHALLGVTETDTGPRTNTGVGTLGGAPPHPMISNAIPSPDVNDTKVSSEPVQESLT